MAFASLSGWFCCGVVGGPGGVGFASLVAGKFFGRQPEDLNPIRLSWYCLSEGSNQTSTSIPSAAEGESPQNRSCHSSCEAKAATTQPSSQGLVPVVPRKRGATVERSEDRHRLGAGDRRFSKTEGAHGTQAKPSSGRFCEPQGDSRSEGWGACFSQRRLSPSAGLRPPACRSSPAAEYRTRPR